MRLGAKGRAETVALRAHNAHRLQRRQAIGAILRRPEAERLVVELVEWLIAKGAAGDLSDPSATAMIAHIQAANPDWLCATGGHRLPTLPIRIVASRRR